MNPVGAEWCGMCHRRFPPADISVEPIESPADILFGREVPDEAPSVDVPSAPRTSGSAVGKKAGAFKPQVTGAFTVTDAGISWMCSKCDTKNPLEAQVCSVCGTTFAEVVQPKVEKPKRDPNMAALLSLFLPGAGHAYIGSIGQGIARAVLSIWVLSVVALSLFAGGRSNSHLLAIVFGVIATMLWMVDAHDAYREARSEMKSVILKGKVFLYLTLGLLMLLFVLLVSASFQASR